MKHAVMYVYKEESRSFCLFGDVKAFPERRLGLEQNEMGHGPAGCEEGSEPWGQSISHEVLGSSGLRTIGMAPTKELASAPSQENDCPIESISVFSRDHRVFLPHPECSLFIDSAVFVTGS